MGLLGRATCIVYTVDFCRHDKILSRVGHALNQPVGLNRTGHLSVQPGQDRTPKFAGRVLPDRTKSGPIFFPSTYQVWDVNLIQKS